MKFEGIPGVELKPIETLETKENDGNFFRVEFVKKIKEVYQEGDLDRLDEFKKMTEHSDNILEHIIKKRFNKDDWRSMFLRLIRYAKNGNPNSMNEFVSVLKDYAIEADRLYLKAKKEVKVYRKEFIAEAKALLNNLGNYDIKKVEHIVNNIQVDFYVPILDSTYKGSYSNNHSIDLSIDSALYPSELRSILFHELLHSLSPDFERVFDIGEDSGFKEGISQQITGLSMSGLDVDRFVWLNEAVTESLAVEMAYGSSGGPAGYVKNIDLLGLFLKKKKLDSNLNFDLIAKTYFRYLKKRDDTDETPVDEWRNFSKEFDKAFGPRFLVKLDRFIEKEGIEKALEVVGKWKVGRPMLEDLTI